MKCEGSNEVGNAFWMDPDGHGFLKLKTKKRRWGKQMFGLNKKCVVDFEKELE